MACSWQCDVDPSGVPHAYGLFGSHTDQVEVSYVLSCIIAWLCLSIDLFFRTINWYDWFKPYVKLDINCLVHLLIVEVSLKRLPNIIPKRSGSK